MPVLKYSQKKKWTSPGSFIYTGTQKVDKLKISLFTYDKHDYSVTEIESPEAIPSKIQNGKVNWINITGLHDTSMIEAVAKQFSIHPLVTEDILNVNHSPKYENYLDYIFVIAKMIDLNEDKSINIEQVSFILGKNYLITFQEDEADVFDLLRERIKNNTGRIRSNGNDYLFYRLVDSIVDNYYTVLETVEDNIDEIDEIITPGKLSDSLGQVYNIRKGLMQLRRAVFPLLETIHAVQRDRESFFSKNTYLFLRDLQDHIKYIYESIENYRETLTGMIEVHMSSESHRLNEVIKVLTIISTIFIPLTFLVGVYGMNFNTRISKWNMPEINWIYGYPFAWLIMLLVTAGMIIFFKRKKWF